MKQRFGFFGGLVAEVRASWIWAASSSIRATTRRCSANGGSWDFAQPKFVFD